MTIRSKVAEDSFVRLTQRDIPSLLVVPIRKRRRFRVSYTYTSEGLRHHLRESGDDNPIHTSSLRPIIPGTYHISIISGLITKKITGEGAWVFEISKVKFRGRVRVGDKVDLYVKVGRIINSRKGIIRLKATMFVSDKNNKRRKVASGNFTLRLPRG